MERILKRQQRTVGAIIKIPLENDYHTYGRILESKIAFYDCKTKEEKQIDEILKSKVLFVIAVYNDFINSGVWLKVSKKIPVEQYLIDLENIKSYRQDYFTGKYFLLIDGKDVEVEKEKIIGLESWTIWGPSLVEQRLNDFYAKRFNKETYDNLNGRQTSGTKELMQKFNTNIEFGGHKLCL